MHRDGGKAKLALKRAAEVPAKYDAVDENRKVVVVVLSLLSLLSDASIGRSIGWFAGLSVRRSFFS